MWLLRKFNVLQPPLRKAERPEQNRWSSRGNGARSAQVKIATFATQQVFTRQWICSRWSSCISECLFCAISVLNSNVKNCCLSWELKGSIQVMRENSVWGKGYLGRGSSRIYSDSLMELHSTLFLQYPFKIKVSGENGGGTEGITLSKVS